MNLVIDIGNTIIKTGLFKKEKMLLRGTFSTHPDKESDEWGILLKNWLEISPEKTCIDIVVISSVAQSALVPIRKAMPRYFRVSPLELTHKIAGIPILCDNPEEVGADRIANAVAVKSMYKMPAVVVDFGTATTFDVISERGEYVGGVIAPGIRVASESLWQRAERLFPVEFKKPDRVIGKNTTANLISGIFYTSVGMVREILDRIEKEIGQEINVIATGGWGRVISLECEKIKEVNPNLTLQGLNFIALRGGKHNGR
ncbi:type III pantothenate kinase [Candidatus Aerophobetes bacterium]|nr:type III pantothenate kinase [Candidatus Aerophobetes bacterium]